MVSVIPSGGVSSVTTHGPVREEPEQARNMLSEVRARSEHSTALSRDLSERMSRSLTRPDTRLSFFVHEATQRVCARLIDARTLETLREVPPERQLELLARIRNAVGIFLDTKA